MLWRFFFQNCNELKLGESSAYFPLREVTIQSAEDARVVAIDEEDFVALQIKVAFRAFDQQLNWGDEDAERWDHL